METHSALTAARQLSGKMQELEVLSRHGQRLSRRFQATLKQLLDLQDRRKQQEASEMKDAVAVGKLQKMKEKPYIPSEFGFVLKNPQIDLFMRRTEAIDEAEFAGEFKIQPQRVPRKQRPPRKLGRGPRRS